MRQKAIGLFGNRRIIMTFFNEDMRITSNEDKMINLSVTEHKIIRLYAEERQITIRDVLTVYINRQIYEDINTLSKKDIIQKIAPLPFVKRSEAKVERINFRKKKYGELKEWCRSNELHVTELLRFEIMQLVERIQKKEY